MCKKIVISVLLFLGISLFAATSIKNLQANQRWPWNGLVDITYSIESDDTDATYLLAFSAHNNDTDTDVEMVTLSGDGVDNAVQAGGPYHTVWNMGVDAPNTVIKNLKVKLQLKVTVVYMYMVVNLSGGPDATSYPVLYTNDSPDLSSDTCRTTELWLRRIPAGTFTMGSPDDELGRDTNEVQHQVTISNDFYIGVFEVTQKQFELVMGSNPSSYKGDTRPVENVSYNDIRGTGATAGAGWPAYGHAVDADSFLGKLRAKTENRVFDLPTEAQWEYACRAGTSTALNSGKNLTSNTNCSNMSEVGRYGYNKTDGNGGYEKHTTVGSYQPNAWGLYDMHGNVWEWCLDWVSNYGTTAVTNPEGPGSGSNRVLRGGYWNGYAQLCRSSRRNDYDPSSRYSSYGFRVAAVP